MYTWIIKQIIFSLVFIVIIHCLIQYYVDTFSNPHIVDIVDHTNNDYLDILHTIKNEDLVNENAGTNRFPRGILEKTPNDNTEAYIPDVRADNSYGRTFGASQVDAIHTSKPIYNNKTLEKEHLSSISQAPAHTENDKLLSSNITHGGEDSMQRELKDHQNNISHSGEKKIPEIEHGDHGTRNNLINI